jgi:histidinol dehydrogenase
MSDSLFRYVGSLASLRRAPEARRHLLDRATSGDPAIRATTAGILDRVRQRGDDALHELARELDRVDVESLEVSRRIRRSALDNLSRPLRGALERAAANIAAAHKAFMPVASEVETEPGVIVGRRPDPLGAVGVYAPGGRGAYPSSVLMGVIPARIAGVGTVVLCSPPGAAGAPSAVVLAASEIAGADRVFAIGGAGAIAAMAYGTRTVPRVSRIVGPGNAFVAEAKLQVQASGAVAIDSPAGPSELLVIADSTADPAVIAREMLAQAEHDPGTSVVLVTNDEILARATMDAIVEALPYQQRSEIIAQALATRSAILWGVTLDETIDFATEFAPEHLLLAGTQAEARLDDIRNAGTVFVGAQSSVAFGDYMTGANHVLPTGGAARSYSGLSTSDFIRWTTYQRVSLSGAAALAGDVAAIADAEELSSHAVAARAWGAPS